MKLIGSVKRTFFNPLRHAKTLHILTEDLATLFLLGDRYII